LNPAADDFGAAAPTDPDPTHEDPTGDDIVSEELGDPAIEAIDELDVEDPFSGDDLFGDDAVIDAAAAFEEQEEFFDTEPTATGEDPSDLDF